MYRSAVFFNDDDAEVLADISSRRKVFDPRQVLEPPSAKELRKLGGVKTVREWKNLHWGTERTGDAALRDVRGGKVLSFTSEDCPRGLLRALAERGGYALSISQDGSDVRVYSDKEEWQGADEVFGREDLLRQKSLWELVDGRLRAPAEIRQRDLQRLYSGRAVWASFPWGRESLQRDLFGGPEARVVFDDTEPLDDVLFVRRGKSGFWIDLLCR